MKFAATELHALSQALKIAPLTCLVGTERVPRQFFAAASTAQVRGLPATILQGGQQAEEDMQSGGFTRHKITSVPTPHDLV